MGLSQPSFQKDFFFPFNFLIGLFTNIQILVGTHTLYPATRQKMPTTIVTRDQMHFFPHLDLSAVKKISPQL